MKIQLKSGVDKLLFGMKEKDVKAIYGEPDRNYKDEDKNVIYLYNTEKLRLTFYADEDFRLGYIIGSHPELELFGKQLISMPWTEVERASSVKKFEKETIDTIENYFNEDNWVLFQVEFGEVVKVEVGAIINSKDEFDWKFKA